MSVPVPGAPRKKTPPEGGVQGQRDVGLYRAYIVSTKPILIMPEFLAVASTSASTS